MTYVPDTIVYTIEYIEGNGLRRMFENLLRWSGNMLRNGMRAIALGPKRVGGYIWWCLIDQRLSIWTILFGWSAAWAITLFVTPQFLFTYILWVSLTRLLISSSLWVFSTRIYLSYPFILYANQLISAFIKVYMLFRLPKQRWANRKAQRSGDDVMADPWKRRMSNYVSTVYLMFLLTGVLLLTGIFKWPEMYQVL